jgi:ABC-2 type transport system permease protein
VTLAKLLRETPRTGMSRNVWVVLRREYLYRVRSRWFLIATAGVPLLMLGLFLLPRVLEGGTEREGRELAVVDATGVLVDRLAPALEDAGWNVERVAWVDDVLRDLERRAEGGELVGFLVLDDATLRTGEGTLYALRQPSTLRRLAVRSAVASAVLEYNLNEQGVDASAILRGGALRVELLSEEEVATDDPRFVVAYAGAFLLYMVILLYAVAVMRATLEEKASRVVEIVISSMEPWHLMLGKILGVGAVSFTQMAIWLLAGAALAALGAPLVQPTGPDLAQVVDIAEAFPGPARLVLFGVFFVFGFLMYSGLYAAVGAMCSTDDEAQQAQLPLMLFLVAPVLMALPVIERPMTPVATALSLFPLFTPILMWGRVATGGVPAWQIALSIALMTLSVLAIAWIAGRIYKVGILMTGKRPTLPEVWRWVREA